MLHGCSGVIASEAKQSSVTSLKPPWIATAAAPPRDEAAELFDWISYNPGSGKAPAMFVVIAFFYLNGIY